MFTAGGIPLYEATLSQKERGRALAVLREDAIILPEWTPVRDQGELNGLCAPCSVTTAIEHMFGEEAVELSEKFLYWMVKKDRNDFTEGALVGEVARAAQRHGICRKELYEGGEPSKEAKDDAASRTAVLVPVLATGERMALEVIELLRTGHKVPFGCPVDRSLLEFRPGTYWAHQDELLAHETVLQAPAHPVGEHSMCIAGWRASDGAYLVQSSWGRAWGLGGYAWISRKYLTMWGSAGFCYVTQPAG